MQSMNAIQALGRCVSPRLGEIQALVRQSSRASKSLYTSLQQEQIQKALSFALTGKSVVWSLNVRDVSENSLYFFLETYSAEGICVTHTDNYLAGSLTVVYQTRKSQTVQLSPGQSIIASGQIVSAKGDYPHHQIMLTDSIAAPEERAIFEGAAVPRIAAPESASEEISPASLCAIKAAAPLSKNSEVRMSYQTAPLCAYSPRLLQRAEKLYELTSRIIGGRARRFKGSFSFVASSSPETVTKIVIYERGLGRENGTWRMLADGIYILVRCNGEAGGVLWNSGLLQATSYAHRFDQNQTLAIAPKHSERFAYSRLETNDEIEDVAEFLATCSKA